MEAQTIESPERRRTGHELLDIVTSVCALVISAISIYMAYDNGRDMQKLVHANSWPALQLFSGNSGPKDERMIYFRVVNAGVGPARIHSFEFLVDDKPIGDDGYTVKQLAEACCADGFARALERAGGGDYEAIGDSGTAPIAHTFLSPGREIGALGWPLTEKNADLWHAVDEQRKRGRLTTRACYCSVFDECWIADARTFPPRKVANCDPPARPPAVRPVDAQVH